MRMVTLRRPIPRCDAVATLTGHRDPPIRQREQGNQLAHTHMTQSQSASEQRPGVPAGDSIDDQRYDAGSCRGLQGPMDVDDCVRLSCVISQTRAGRRTRKHDAADGEAARKSPRKKDRGGRDGRYRTARVEDSRHGSDRRPHGRSEPAGSLPRRRSHKSSSCPFFVNADVVEPVAALGKPLAHDVGKDRRGAFRFVERCVKTV